jgi:IclR family transcriptional regulator, acetate operon repressor
MLQQENEVRLPESADQDNSGQLIARIAVVLQTVANHALGLNMSQLARVTGLPRTTVQRLVAALTAQRFLTINNSGHVRLGPTLARLATAAHVDVANIVRPHIEELRRSVDETAHLWVVAEDEMVLIDRVLCSHEVSISTPLGARLPFACNAGGKSYIATLPDAEVLKLVAGRLTSMTVHSLVTPEALLHQLEEVRRTGVAYDLEEHIEDVCAIGTLLRTETSQQYAICLAAPSRRFRVKRKELVRALIDCRDEIEKELGVDRTPAATNAAKRTTNNQNR